jgi:DNA-binding MarR family transcriptional regulator
MELEKEIYQKKFRNETQKLVVNLIYTFNWLNTINSAFLKPYGITLQQYNVLRILRGQQPNTASIKLIRERMLDKMSDASRIVEKLRIKGFVGRKTSADDRRSCDVVITEKGLRLLVKIDNDINPLEQLFLTLDTSETKQLNFLLDKLRG